MSYNINFMRKEDFKILDKNINILMDKAIIKKIELVEPVIDEFKKIRKIILDFIKINKRIVYGGYAWNNLIQKVSPKDVFYKDTDYTDIEFYSNKPIEDLIKLCDILYSYKFKYIQGKNAQHFDTYTIFVNFNAYCDITYMPSNIYYNIMTEQIDGIRLIHPKVILVDILRQFTDPIISFWRLEKNIARGKLILENYPLKMNYDNTDIKLLNEKQITILYSILPEICKLDSILFIGFVALEAFFNPNKDINKQLIIYNCKPIEIVSCNLKNDVSKIYNLIIKFFLNNNDENINDVINIEQYYPFFQFTDYSIIFRYKGSIFLIIYGNNERCNPYINVKFKIPEYNEIYNIKIGSFNYVFMYNLIKYHISYINKKYHLCNLYDSIMYKSLLSRDKFLNKYNKTILDKTIFEDFKIECIGTAISPLRKFMLSRFNKKLLPKSAIHPYIPEEQKSNYEIDSYNFNNYSGNIINNPKDMIINIKIS